MGVLRLPRNRIKRADGKLSARLFFSKERGAISAGRAVIAGCAQSRPPDAAVSAYPALSEAVPERGYQLLPASGKPPK